MSQNHLNKKNQNVKVKSEKKEFTQEELNEREYILRDLEEQYKFAAANAANRTLVVQYESLLSYKQEYENYGSSKDSHINSEKSYEELKSYISNFRIQHVGVDKRDLESIKTQLNVYRASVESYRNNLNNQSAPQM